MLKYVDVCFFVFALILPVVAIVTDHKTHFHLLFHETLKK